MNQHSIARSSAASRIADDERKLLVIDTSFTLAAIRERQVEHSVTCRDLDGFFAHVWSVHPFATLMPSDKPDPRYGKPVTYKVAPRHTVIEARVGRFQWLAWAFPLNFLLAQLGLFARLLRLIAREKISAIRVGSPLYIGLFGLALARICGIPLIVRVGGNFDKIRETTGHPMEPRLMRSAKLEKRAERFVLSRADLVAGANQDNLDFALASGAHRERSTLFRYGNLVDPGHFTDPEQRTDDSCLRELGVERDNFLLYVGRLERVKHPDHVLDVLAAVRKRGFRVKAVLAGEGTMRGKLYEQAGALGLEDQVVLPGNLGQVALAQLFPAAAVVISPHTGRALSEAAFGAAAVVAYDVDWQGELIEDGITGLLVPNEDLVAMIEAVAMLLQDESRRRSLGRALRRRAQEMLDPETLNEHERRQYEKLFAR